MVSAKGVQAISPYVIAQDSGKFKCKRGEYESPKALGNTYASSHIGLCPRVYGASGWTRQCTTYVVKTRLVLEPCFLKDVELFCLSAYSQGRWGSSLVERERGFGY